MIKKVPTTTNPGVYALVNIENGKCYIGKSKNIFQRISQYLYKLDNGTHEIKEMQEDYNQNLFKIVVLKEFDKGFNEKRLSNEEQLYIALYQSYKPEHGYNTVCTFSIFEPDDIIKIKQQQEINKLIDKLEKTMYEAEKAIKEAERAIRETNDKLKSLYK